MLRGDVRYSSRHLISQTMKMTKSQKGAHHPRKSKKRVHCNTIEIDTQGSIVHGIRQESVRNAGEVAASLLHISIGHHLTAST